MNRQEAIEALDNCKTLTHAYFCGDEWVRGLGNGNYLFEDGVVCSQQEFWIYRMDEGFDFGWREYLGDTNEQE